MDLIKFIFTDPGILPVTMGILALMATGVYLCLPKRHTRRRRHSYR